MALSIITNTASQLAADSVANNQISLNQSIAQLSSGKRIVSAADDPAGLAISLQISGLLGALGQASTNAGNAHGMLSTADGGLANIGTALTTMQQLANEAADGTINGTQRAALDSQYQALFKEIDNIAQGAQFNGISLLKGGSVTFQVGANNNTTDQLTLALPSITAAGLLGVALPGAGTAIVEGTNATVNAPGANTLVVGTTAASDTGTAANTVATTAAASTIDSQLSGTPPNSISLTVTGITGGGPTAAVGTDSITFVLKDSNGVTSAPITITAANTIVKNLDGTGVDFLFTAADTYKVGDQIAIVFGAAGASASLATQSAAQSQVSQTTAGLATLSSQRGSVGASEQQLATIAANLQSEQQNLTAALSNIQDANVASTFAKFTKQLVLQQAGVSVLRQANNAPQQLLALFQ
jgi:flagellin